MSQRKVDAYDEIAKAYGLSTSEANAEQCVTEATFARKMRDDATRVRDEAVNDADRLRASVAALDRMLAYARLAASVSLADLREIAAACGQRDDEYYRQAIERRIAELTAKANEVPGLTATLDEFGHAIVRVRAWLDCFADSIPEHEYQELASILSDAPWHPPKEDR